MFSGVLSLSVIGVASGAYYLFDTDPFELTPPITMPPLKTIMFQPLDEILTDQSGNSSFPLYFLDNTGSTVNLPAISFSIINIFGIKTASGANPMLTLYDDKQEGRSIEFQLGSPCRLNVTGMNKGGLWVAQSRIKDYSSNSYRWFTLERNPNYIAIYEPLDHSYPILDYDNMHNDAVDFTTFTRFTVRSPGYTAQWDFLGYHFQPTRPVKGFVNKYVAHALADVKEQVVRFQRRKWRCDFALFKVLEGKSISDFAIYWRDRCKEPDLVRYSEDQEQRLGFILLVNGIPLPTAEQYNDSLVIFHLPEYLRTRPINQPWQRDREPTNAS